MFRRRLGTGLLVGGLLLGFSPAFASPFNEADARKLIAHFSGTANCEGRAGKFPEYSLEKTTRPVPKEGLTVAIPEKDDFFNETGFPSKITYDFSKMSDNLQEVLGDEIIIAIYIGDQREFSLRERRGKVQMLSVEKCSPGGSPERSNR